MLDICVFDCGGSRSFLCLCLNFKRGSFFEYERVLMDLIFKDRDRVR